METQSIGKPSSPHAESLGDPQYAQSSTGDAQTHPDVDPCEPPYSQISVIDTQTDRLSQSDIDLYDPPWNRIEYH